MNTDTTLIKQTLWCNVYAARMAITDMMRSHAIEYANWAVQDFENRFEKKQPEAETHPIISREEQVL